MFGLAAFNSILLGIQFAPVFYGKLAIAFRNNFLRMRLKYDSHFEEIEYKPDLRDVLETFPAIGRSFLYLKDYEGDEVEEIFALRFDVSYANLFGNEVTVELKEYGANTSVTKENREEFIELDVEYLINESSRLR